MKTQSDRALRSRVLLGLLAFVGALALGQALVAQAAPQSGGKPPWTKKSEAGTSGAHGSQTPPQVP